MKILIADDEALWANLIKGIFEGHNYQVVVTLKGNEVPDLASKENVDLVLLDVNFPDTNGFLICEKMMKNPQTRNIPVVLLTAQSDPSDLKKGLELGASDYVEKHSSSLELLARVQSVLKRKTRFKYFYNYESIIESSPFATALIRDNRFHYLNKTFYSLFGYTEEEELIQKEYSIIIHDDDMIMFQSLLDQVFQSESIETFEFKGKFKDESEKILKGYLNKIEVNGLYFALFNCVLV